MAVTSATAVPAADAAEERAYPTVTWRLLGLAAINSIGNLGASMVAAGALIAAARKDHGLLTEQSSPHGR